jgi:hypothetical protein
MMLGISRILPIILMAVLAGGCASICSTMLTRDEANCSWQRHTHLPGVPITLKVPTHVKIYIYETFYLQKVSDGGITRTERLKLPFSVRDFAQEFIYTEKIFTVDFKRPAAGTFNLRLDMTDDQYIQNVQHDVTDRTIQDVTDLVHGLVPKGLLPSLAGGVNGETNDPLSALTTIKSVVAVGIFEIDAPDFEQQLTCFINCHLTQAHDAWTTAPSVRAIHRIPFTGYQQDGNLCGGPIAPSEGLPPGAPTLSPGAAALPPGSIPENYYPNTFVPPSAGSGQPPIQQASPGNPAPAIIPSRSPYSSF